MDGSLDLLGAGRGVDAFEDGAFAPVAQRTLSQEMEQLDLAFILDGSGVVASFADVDAGVAPPLAAALSAAALPGAFDALPRTPPAVVPVTPPSVADVCVSWQAMLKDGPAKRALATAAPAPSVVPVRAAAPARAPKRRRSPRTSAGGKQRAARPARAAASGGLPLRPTALTVQQLREELRSRGLTTNGHKPELVARLKTALAKPAAQQTAMSTLRRYKRPKSKREPRREEYDTPEAFHGAWTRWREWRDDNNRSVKRSRERKKMQDRRETKQAAAQEHENSALEKTVAELKRQVALLTRGIGAPASLSAHERRDISRIMAAHEFTPLP